MSASCLSVSCHRFGGHGFNPGLRHTKDVKMVPVATMLGAQHL